MKYLALIYLTLCVSLSILAQTKSDLALNKILATEFWTQCNQMREAATKEVKQFKNEDVSRLKPEEVRRVKESYETFVLAYNKMLLNVKSDLLDKKKRKWMMEFPDDYARAWKGEYDAVEQLYRNGFRRTINEVTHNESMIIWLPVAIEVIREGIKLIIEIRNELKAIDEQAIELKLYQAFKLPEWDKI